MNENDLIQLLRRGDAATDQPASPVPGLAARARRLARRRQRRRNTGAVLASLLATGFFALTLFWLRDEAHRTVAVIPHGGGHSNRPIAPAPDDLAATAWLGSRQPRHYASLVGSQPAGIPQYLSEQRNEAAATIVVFANRSALEPSLQADAAGQYELVMTSFADTRWAGFAREQLSKLRRHSS